LSPLEQEIASGTDFYTIMKLDPTKRHSYISFEITDQYNKLMADNELSESDKSEIAEAHRVLSNSSMRFYYDQYGRNFKQFF
jgi:DnaJ-class molecular chaperone